MPVREDFFLAAGDDLVLQFTVSSGEAISLAGATVHWWAARSVDEPGDSAAIKKSTGDGIAITDPENRKFEVTLTSEDTEHLRGAYYHEAEVIIAGRRTTVTFGEMLVTPSLVGDA